MHVTAECHLGKIIEAPKSYKPIADSRRRHNWSRLWRWGVAQKAAG